MHSSNYQNELEHFGIKGMKWGIRRTPEQLGHKKISRSKFKSGFYSRDDDEDITIPKKTKLYRMTYDDSDPQKNMYVTRSKMDRNFYKWGYSSSLMGLGNRSKLLKENTYTTNEELRIPSFNTRKAAFEEVSKNKKIRKDAITDLGVQFVKQNAEVKVSSLKDAKDLLKDKTLLPEQREVLKASITGSNKYAKTLIKDLDSEDPVIKARTMSRIISASESARNAYTDILKKKGYNATVDDFGRKGLFGTAGETSEALIIFNPSSANKTRSVKVTDYETNKLLPKKQLTDIKYDAKVLDNPQAKQQLAIYGNMKAKRALTTVGAYTVGMTVPGAMFVIDALYNNSAYKANTKINELEAEKRKNWK